MEICIKNISRQVTADSLAAIFSTYGHVVSTSLSHPVNNNHSKTAIIVMLHENEARTAIEQLNGCFVDGQILMVEKISTGNYLSGGNFYRQARIFFQKGNPLSLLVKAAI